MDVVSTAIPDVKVITPKKHADPRGFFSETFNRQALKAAGIDIEFVQDNHSLSADRGVVRGLHYQIPPFAQAKLVRVIRGAILDVAVDLRTSSSTFGQHVSVVLRAENWNQILVPVGFAHGFATLEPNTEVLYKVDNYWSRECERGILWNDPDLAISWPNFSTDATLSAKDAMLPRWSQVTDVFR